MPRKKKQPEYPCPKCGHETEERNQYSISRLARTFYARECHVCGWSVESDSAHGLIEAYFKELKEQGANAR